MFGCPVGLWALVRDLVPEKLGSCGVGAQRKPLPPPLSLQNPPPSAKLSEEPASQGETWLIFLGLIFVHKKPAIKDGFGAESQAFILGRDTI